MSKKQNPATRLGRSPRGFDRKSGTYNLRPRILIVCEGEKTEPNYLNDVVSACRLTAADVRIVGKECDSAPISVVTYAENLYNDSDPKFQYIFCVFDRDRHETFHDAVRKLEKLGAKGFSAINSDPCFEYWLLLHFRYTRKSYVKTGSKSPGDVLEAELCQEFKRAFGIEYRKGMPGIYGMLVRLMDDAARRAEQAVRDVHATNDPNPSTDVLRLINFLRNQSVPPQESLPVNRE